MKWKNTKFFLTRNNKKKLQIFHVFLMRLQLYEHRALLQSRMIKVIVFRLFPMKLDLSHWLNHLCRYQTDVVINFKSDR